MACLLIVSGQQEGTYYQLTRRRMAGGRDPAMEIQIIDPKVSRRHFLIFPEDERYVIRELRSKNGVFVNGSRIDGEQMLQDGDEVAIGDTVLSYFDADHPDRSDSVQKYRLASRNLREEQTIGMPVEEDEPEEEEEN